MIYRCGVLGFGLGWFGTLAACTVTSGPHHAASCLEVGIAVLFVAIWRRV